MSSFIESPQNPRIKRLVALRQRKERTRQQVILVEGVREIRAALKAGLQLQECYRCDEYLNEEAKDLASSRLFLNQAFEDHLLSTRAFEKVAVRDQAGGVIAVFTSPKMPLIEQCSYDPERPLLILDRVEKPGNLGAILRTSDAAGISGLIVDEDSVDPYSPNVIRASLGAVFTVPLFRGDRQAVQSFCTQHQIRLLAADPAATEWHFQKSLAKNVAFILGSEAFGVSDDWLKNADQSIKIPMVGEVNSLNVSVAAAILLYEQVRQRHQ